MWFCFSSSPGPSTSIDTACSSSLLALENAFHAIRHGQCDAALVGGVNLLLKPNTSVQFMKLGMLSPEGTCKSFDSSGKLSCEALVWQSGSRLICILHFNSLLFPVFSSPPPTILWKPLSFARKWILPFRGCSGSTAHQALICQKGLCHCS